MASVQTVRGPINSDELGITLMHEHVFCDIRKYFTRPREIAKMALADAPVSIEILGTLRRDPMICKDNLVLLDEDVQVQELKWLRQYGGRSIVDLSNIGLRRDPTALRRVSAKTGLNIVASTGFYVQLYHPPYVKKKSVEELKDIIVREINEGIDRTGVKAGAIGECGCSSPVPYHPDEKKTIMAAARAQRETGAPLTIHPSLIDVERKLNSVTVGEVYIDLVEKEGADLRKFYLSHADRTCWNLDYHRRLLSRGVSLSYDCFGKFYYFDSAFVGAGGMNDVFRINALVQLCREGYDKQLLMSHDICMKTDLRRYGGFGYSHVLEHVVPQLRAEGVKRKEIRQMLVDNPKRLLAF